MDHVRQLIEGVVKAIVLRLVWKIQLIPDAPHQQSRMISEPCHNRTKCLILMTYPGGVLVERDVIIVYKWKPGDYCEPVALSTVEHDRKICRVPYTQCISTSQFKFFKMRIPARSFDIEWLSISVNRILSICFRYMHATRTNAIGTICTSGEQR